MGTPRVEGALASEGIVGILIEPNCGEGGEAGT